jgi:hypothetical protein
MLKECVKIENKAKERTKLEGEETRANEQCSGLPCDRQISIYKPTMHTESRCPIHVHRKSMLLIRAAVALAIILGGCLVVWPNPTTKCAISIQSFRRV